MFLVNKFGYSCWNGEQYTSFEACPTYGPFDPCASVNILDYFDSFLQDKNFVDFAKFCLDERKWIVRKNR